MENMVPQDQPLGISKPKGSNAWLIASFFVPYATVIFSIIASEVFEVIESISFGLLNYVDMSTWQFPLVVTIATGFFTWKKSRENWLAFLFVLAGAALGSLTAMFLVGAALSGGLF